VYGSRIAEIVLGLIFVAGATLKAFDIQAFAVQISYYGIVVEPFQVRVAALGAVALETGLGVALLANFGLRRSVLAVSFLLLLGFSGLIAYAWAFKGLQDCGCFGKYLKMTPAVSLVKNALMGAAVLYAAFAAVRGGGEPVVAAITRRRGKVILAAGAVALVVTATATGKSTHGFFGAEFAVRGEGPFSGLNLSEGGVKLNLARGEHLVALLSATCAHCKVTVAKLNELTLIPEFPPLIGLMLGDEATLEDFKLQTSPRFPCHLIDPLVFFQLIGEVPPRLSYIRNGMVIQSWDGEMPELTNLAVLLGGK
jgi:hypothetical protein